MMRLHRLVRERLHRRLHDDLTAPDAGMSVAELLVGMAVMSVFMAMFTGAIILMTSGVNHVEATTTTTAQVQHAFDDVDKTARYASAISPPGQGTGTGDWYVELSVPGIGGASTCYQMRVDPTAQQLQRRSWSVDSAGNISAASTFLPLADFITNGTASSGSSDVPFQMVTRSDSKYQQLQLVLRATSTSPATSTTSSSVTFTALNSSADSSTAACQQKGRP